MRTFLIALAVASLAGTVFAQDLSGRGGGGREMPDPNAAEKKQKAEELDKAYSAGLKEIPDQTKKADPWGSVRPATGAGTGGKKPAH